MNRRQALQMATVMLGGILSPGLIRASSAGFETEANSENRPFSADTRKQVALLAEIIIPTTNTPGAVEAGVPQFIEMMVNQWYTTTEREIFMQGLQALNDWSNKECGQPLVDCNAEQLTRALSQSEQRAQQYRAQQSASFLPGATDENTPFFTKIKELTVLGYFTSEVGIKQSLAYNPMPMEYRGDIPLTEGDKQWAQY